MNKRDLHRLLQRPIAVYPIFIEIAGGILNGVFLSQLFYWSDKGMDPDGWIYKTQLEWKAETHLTRYEQERARAALRELGLLEEKKAGLPARLYFRLNYDRLFELLMAPVEIEVDEEGNPIRKKLKNSVPPQLRIQKS